MSTISITALDDPIAVVHIPIDLATQLATELYWTIDAAPSESNEFFNITSNTVEIAIFARTNLVNLYWTTVGCPEVKINSVWRVFEISSGDQGETNNYGKPNSPHLRHVSAPLSRAGISILYQSSYFTDFLLVKGSDFGKASQIFAEQGWHVDPTMPTSRRRSQLLSPVTPMSQRSPSPTEPAVLELTVLPAPLACVGFSHSNERTTAERIRQLVVWPEKARQSWQRKRLSHDSQVEQIAQDPQRQRPFISYTRTDEGASIVTETKILRWMFGRKHVSHDEANDEEQVPDVEQTTDFQLGGQLAAGYITDSTDLPDSEDEDMPTSRQSSAQISAIGLHTPPLDDTRRVKHLSLPTTPGDSPRTGTIPIAWSRANRRSTISLKADADRLTGHHQQSDRPGRKRCLQLDLSGLGDDEALPVESQEGPLDVAQQNASGTSSAYHMDKSGLVMRFSDLLNQGSIRMLYSSTYHTANILVEAKDVHRAKRLLRGSENSPTLGHC